MAVTPLTRQLPPITPEAHRIVALAEQRRISLQGDLMMLRERYAEVLRWCNPPWDSISRRVDPRPEDASAARQGINKIHVDLVGQSVSRWAGLQAGIAPVLRVRPTPVYPPIEEEGSDPESLSLAMRLYNIDRQEAQLHSSQMEGQTQEWSEAANLHRTLLWAAWTKEAFGKAILRSSWDPYEDRPTVELLEDPSKVGYGWTRRYGNRKLAWVLVIDQLSVEEAEFLYGVQIPRLPNGGVDMSMWTGMIETGEMDQQPEQIDAIGQFLWVMEHWELERRRDERGELVVEAVHSLIVCGRVVEGPTRYPYKRLPFHILENEHIPTWLHGKSLAEALIPINHAYDDMLDREQLIIRFESGPRYKGLNMLNSAEEVDIPDPFNMVPLRDGQDIQQIDTRIDLWPAQIHSTELKDAHYKTTGLTPIAWGMSPNAQTSGRAMSAEWRAVEIPLTWRLVTWTPDVRDLLASWWDYAEVYSSRYKEIGRGHRAFSVLWVPIDIRDGTEKTLDIIQRLQANILDPETAIEETGKENSDEIMARVKAYLLDPVYNPLRAQQYLLLRQLAIQIRQQELQTQAMEAELGGAQGEQGVEETAQQGANAAAQGAQGPGGPVTPAQNQPGQTPQAPLIEQSILSQSPLQNGVGNRIVAPLTMSPPSNGQQPR